MKKIVYLITLIFISLGACKKDDSPIDEPLDKPVITSIQPKDPKPGDVVTVSGTGFGTTLSDVKVSIGSTAVTITSVSATEIKFTLPANISAGALSVSIKESVATVTDSQGANITPKPATDPIPTFSAMSVASGKVSDAITLTGTNFSTVLTENTVKFTGATAGATVNAVVKTATATSLTVDVPTGAATGVVSIQVKTATAILATNFNGVFTVTTTPGGGSGTAGQATVLSTLGFKHGSMTTDASGNVYALLANNFGTQLIRIASDKTTKTFTATDFGYTANEFLGVAGVAADRNGLIYVVTVSSMSVSRVYKISAANVAPVKYLELGSAGFGINMPEVNFAATSTGELFYLTGTNPKNVYKISTNGQINTYLDVAYGGATNEYDNVQKPLPKDITLDQNDNLYVAAENETGFKAIYKFTPAKVKSVIYSSTVNAFEAGTLSTAKFKAISSISVSPDGNTFYIGDKTSEYISKMDISANLVSTVAGIGLKADAYNYSQTGANLSVLVYPHRLHFDARTKTVYSLYPVQGVGIQKINL